MLLAVPLHAETAAVQLQRVPLLAATAVEMATAAEPLAQAVPLHADQPVPLLAVLATSSPVTSVTSE